MTLRIAAGERVGLVGTDPAETHAVVYLLSRFLDPTSGEIRIDDKNLKWLTLDSIRAQIGVVLQPNLIFNDTVANNIGCGDPAYSIPQIIEAAKIAHAHQFIQKLPYGYETPIGEMGKLASGRRAVSHRPGPRDPPRPGDVRHRGAGDAARRRHQGPARRHLRPHPAGQDGAVPAAPHFDDPLLRSGVPDPPRASRGRRRAPRADRRNDLYKHLHYLEFNEFAGQT